MAQPHLEGPHFSRSGASHKGRKGDLVERSLAMVHEAHHKVLATAVTLEEEIERLRCTQNHSESRARSKSRDHHGQSREKWKRRCHQVQFEDQPAPSHPTNPKTGPGDHESNGKGSNLEEPPELKLMVASFLRGLPETSEDEGKETPQEPTVLEFSQWVPWEAERCKTPEWWTKLLTVPGREDCRKLAREV